MASQLFEEKIYNLERKQHMRIRDDLAARNRLEGETTVINYWTEINKMRAPQDTMRAVQKPDSNPPEFVTRSDNMAKLA